MKAMTLAEAPSGRSLVLSDLPVPSPGSGEVLIKVHAVGVTPTEVLWYPTTHTKAGGARTNAVPGHEFSGTVAAVGAEVQGFREGDEVYGMNDWFIDGGTAEYCLTLPTSIAPKPASLSHVRAASVPIGALTAWQGVIDKAKLQSGERVLIHGGAGSVGLFAIQIARRLGAEVITTASARHHDLLIALGAQQVLDYKTDRFHEVLRDIDVVFDGVGGETLERSWDVLKPGGRLITIAVDAAGSQYNEAKATFFIVEPNHTQLTEIARLLDAGELQTFPDNVLPLEQASSAYFGGIPRAAGRGKVIIQVLL